MSNDRYMGCFRGAGGDSTFIGMTVVLTLLALLFAATPAAADEALWTLLKAGGHVVMMRHATAPGVYDPPGMRLDDCATQRNLDDTGREEARRIGAAFQARAIPVAKVFSSRWCRCMDTARLAFGRVENWEPIDGAAPGSALEKRRTADVRRFASTPLTGGNVVLVTHNFNIRALTGLSTASGEMVVLTPKGNDTFEIAGRLAPSALTAGP
jgi:phosphohistidine phosphatase SixA